MNSLPWRAPISPGEDALRAPSLPDRLLCSVRAAAHGARAGGDAAAGHATGGPVHRAGAWAPEPSQAPTRPAPAHRLTPLPGWALLYVLRTESGLNGISRQRVEVDGVRVADLVANRYALVALRPGRHTLAVNRRMPLANARVARFEVVPGDIVAYRLQTSFFRPPALESMPDIHEVRAALARLRRSDAV